MTSHLVYRVALWDYLGENLDFDMDKIVIMREEYLKSAILIIDLSPTDTVFFPPISLLSLLFKHFPALSFLLYVFHPLV